VPAVQMKNENEFLEKLKDAIKRNIQRDKPTMNLRKEVKSEAEWKIRIVPDKGDFVINTSQHSINEVVSIILKEINEKRRKNPNAHLIRKCW
jgi:regulator of PEP synthase PpsR (kinase-PPPase family)